MWEHYRKTFWRMQTIIVAVTVCVYFFFGRYWPRAAVFFLVMQISAVIGAVWGARVKAMAAKKDRLPLE